MGVLSEINRLVKQAQLIMPPVYKPEVYRQGADNIVKAVKKVPNAAWGTIGVGAGLAKGVTDRTFGNGAEGSWGDYVRAGWDAGYNHGDMAAAGMIEGAENAIPFAKFEAPTRFADFVRDQKVQGGMDADVADTMRGRANYAGVGVTMLPAMAAWGALGKGFGAVGRFAAPVMKADPTRVGAVAQKFGPLAVLAGQEAPVVKSVAENGMKVMNQAPVDESQKKMRESIDWLKTTAQSHPEMITDDMMGTLNGYYNNGQMSEADFSSIRSSVRRHRAKEFLSQFSPEQQSEILARLNGGSR